MDFSVLFTGAGLFYLLILTLLEIVLGIDNIIFISIITDKLPRIEQRRARIIGLSLALIIRLLLLSVVSLIMSLDSTPIFGLDLYLTDHHGESVPFSYHSLILALGGLFLIYKATKEMHTSVKGIEEEVEAKKKGGISAIITQIVLIDIVFSFDSIITAIGMTNDLKEETHHNPLAIIYAAVIISMIVMLVFSGPISKFINNRPTIKMIALGFLVTIGVILIAEAFGEEIPKGYIYFAMVYALILEFLNIRARKNRGEAER